MSNAPSVDVRPHSRTDLGTADVWRYRDDLTVLARHLCRHHEDAEDVAHSALLKAAASLEGFRGEASVRTWLHRIATNECRMLRRRKAPASLDALLDSDEPRGIDPGVSLEADPEALVIELDTRREVLAAVAALPDRYRCALLLREGEDLSMEEIAAALDTTVPGAKSLLYRARSALRESLT